MQIAPEVHACLNRLLRHELTVINQYFLHARMLNNWGYDALGHTIYKQSIRAMKNADKLIARIFLLEGLPNLQDLGKLLIGETVAEAIACDHRAASVQHADLRDASTGWKPSKTSSPASASRTTCNRQSAAARIEPCACL